MLDHLTTSSASDGMGLSSTAATIEALQLFGYCPFEDEADPRPLPDERTLAASIADIIDAMVAGFAGTRMEPDLEGLLWSTVNLFHRAVSRCERQLDDNGQGLRRSMAEQDGSEVKSVELERLSLEGTSITERAHVFEFMRDHAADLFMKQTGSSWRPQAGSCVNRKTMTASMIDAKDYLNAREQAAQHTLIPKGPKILFAGGIDCQNSHAIWQALDRIHKKHPAMVLIHGGSPKGAERIAECWARQRHVTQIQFKPDWNRHGKSAPFKRNDKMLEVLPIGALIFPGTGIQDNLADKAKAMGIPLMDYRNS